MQLNERLGPVVFAGACALIAGHLNPTFLQARTHSHKPTGYPNYAKMALFTVVMGLVGIALFKIPKCF
jgi:hypothetical protein